MAIFKIHYSLQLILLQVLLSTGTQTVRFITPQSSSVTVRENAGTVNMCLIVFVNDGANTGTVEVDVTTLGLSAVQGMDFVAQSTTLQFSGQGATNCFNIAIINDDILERTESFNVTAAIGTTIMATKTVIIIDDESVTVSLTNSSSLTQTEGDGSIRVCAEVSSLIEQLGMSVTVSFTQSGQSPVPRTFSVGGARVQCLSISNENDQIFEDDTTFTVTLSSTQSRVTATGMTTVFIVDNPINDVTVSLTNSSSLIRTEGDGIIRVCANVTSPTGGLGIPVEVGFTQSGQSPVTKTFSAGGEPVPQCLNDSNEDDQIFEDATTFTVTLSSTQSRVTATGMTTVTIRDNDDVTVSMRDRALTRTEGDGSISVCAEVTSPTGGLGIPVEVRFTQSGQSPVTRTFSAGGARVQCLSISNEDDQIFEDATTFTVTLSSTQNRVTATGMTTVTIRDNDDVTVSMRDRALTGTEGDGSISVCAEVTSPMGGLGIPVEVRFTQSGQSPVTKTFSAGGARVQCLSVSNEDDQIFEDATTFTVTLSSTQNRVTATGTTTVTIMDDDDVALSLTNSSSLNRTEGDGSIIVCANVTSPTGGLGIPVAVNFTQSGQSPVTRTFSAGERVQCLSVSNEDDQIFEDATTLTVTLSSTQSRVTATGMTTVTIMDNDDPGEEGVVITVGMQQPSITQSESAGNVMVCAVLIGPAGGLEGRNAVIQLTPTGQQSVTRTFQSGSRVGSRQCINLTVTNDERFEDDETYTVSLSSSQNMVTATGSTTVTITDDDDPVVGLVQSSYTVREGTDEMVSVCAELLGPSGGLAREFTVILSAHNGTAEPGSDYSATEYSVTRTFHTSITVGSTYQRCLILNITNDTIGEPIESFTVNLSSSNPRVMIATGRSVATVIIIDDDILPGLMPEDFQVTATGPRSLSFSWSAPNNTNETIVGYNVSCSSSGQIVFNRGYMDAGSYEGTTFLPYTNYTCRVFARVMGNVGEAATRTALTHKEPPGSPPRNVTIQESTSSSITLSWQPPVLSYGVITNYNLYINYTNGSEIERREAPSATYTITQLFPYQNVTVEISAENSAGEGRLRASVSTRTRELSPGLVSEVELSAVNETILNVTWIPPERPNGELLYYIVRLHSPMNMDSYLEVNTTMLSVQWTELEPYIPYNISIRAVNSAGEGEVYSDYVFTKEGAPTVSPKNVSVECLGDGTSISVSWTPLTLLEARGRLTNYAVYFWPEEAEIDAAMILNVDGTSNNIVITGLKLNTAYSVRVAASTIEGVGKLSMRNVYMACEVPTGGSDSPCSDFHCILVAVGSGVAFIVFIALIIVGCVVLFCYCMRKKAKIPNKQGRNNETVSPECEIPLPTRRHVDAVPTNRCVAYVNTVTGTDSMEEYEELMDHTYETIID